MKKIWSILKRGVIRGLSYDLILLLIFYFSYFIASLDVTHGFGEFFSDLLLFLEAWNLLFMYLAIDCVWFFLIPCLIGGILISFLALKLKQNMLVIHLLINSLIYIAGLFFMIKKTRTGMELYSYDAIAFGIIILTTILYWVVPQSKKWAVIKAQKPLIKKGILRGIIYDFILLTIFFLSAVVFLFIESLRQSKPFLSFWTNSEKLYAFPGELLTMCFLCLLPCLVGGISYVFIERKKEKASLLMILVIHPLIYLAGFFIMFKLTLTRPIPDYYDAIVFSMVLLASYFYWLVKRNSQKKINPLNPPPLPITNNNN